MLSLHVEHDCFDERRVVAQLGQVGGRQAIGTRKLHRVRLVRDNDGHHTGLQTVAVHQNL